MDEDQLIAAFVPYLPQGNAEIPTGDDAAVVRLAAPRMAVTTDVLVEGRHFRREWSSGADVGWRAIAQNAADVVAMGATPVSFVAAVVVPSGVPQSWVVDLARGMGDACRWLEEATGVACGVVGGDLSGGGELVISVTAHGDVTAEPLVRGGARAGDAVVHSGTLGHSAAGYAALASGLSPGAEGALADVVGTYLRPTPPVRTVLGARLHSLMDVSDGLLRDAGRMARASGVLFDLSPLEERVDATLTAVAGLIGVDPVDWVAGGGEDHGFLGACAPDAVPAGFDIIGTVRPLGYGGADRPAVLVNGEIPTARPGWDHFG